MEESDPIEGKVLSVRLDGERPKSVANGHTVEEPDKVGEASECRKPPDGGARAWLVMVGSFLCNGILFGVINTFGVIHFHLHRKLEAEGDTDTSSKVALIGSLAIGTMFLLSPVAGMLTDRVGLRRTTLLGGALAALGMLLSSFLCHSVPALCFTYGFMYGLGAALAYTPSLAILGHYFSRYLGLVNGIVTAGSSVFTVVMPVVLEYFIANSGLEVTLRVLALLSSLVMLCALLFKPIQTPKKEVVRKSSEEKNCMNIVKSIIHVENWKKRRYVIWVLAIPSALFGYFVPYVHMATFVKTVFNTESNLPVMCIAITSGLGRLIFGYIADLPKVNRIFLQQVAFYSIGLLSMCLPFAQSFGLLLTITLGMGLFDGCFISLLGPVAFDLCGQKGGTQAIGFLLGLCSIPLTLGPPIAGLIYDHTKSYTLPFVLSGIPPLVGATIMFIIYYIKDAPVEAVQTNGHALNSKAWKNDIIPTEKTNGFHSNHEESEALNPAATAPGRLAWKSSNAPYSPIAPGIVHPQSAHSLHYKVPLLSTSIAYQNPLSNQNSYFSCPETNIVDNFEINSTWPLSLKSNYRCNSQIQMTSDLRQSRANYQSITPVIHS